MPLRTRTRNAAKPGVVSTPVRPPDRPASPFLYVNIWKARDGSFEAQAHVSRDDALDEIGAEYPDMGYAGTATLPLVGSAPLTFDDWSEEAHRHAIEANAEWLEEQRERRILTSRVL